MIIKFTETAPLNNKWNSLSPCEPHLGLEEIKIKNGKSYKLLGKSEKTYFLWERICLGIRTLAQTVLTLGGALCFEKNRSDWESFWTGKREFLLDRKNKITWLEQRYQLPWDDRLQYYLTRSQIDFSPHPFEWSFN